MSDFVALAQTFGLPLAMTLTVVAVLARALVVVSRDKDRVSEQRITDLKLQYEARLAEQRAQYDNRLADITEDRDWTRGRLDQALGVTNAGTAALDEAVRRIAKQLPPRRGG